VPFVLLCPSSGTGFPWLISLGRPDVRVSTLCPFSSSSVICRAYYQQAGDEYCPLTTASQSAIFLLLNFLPDLCAEKGADG
jgi:hypothetical protein